MNGILLLIDIIPKMSDSNASSFAIEDNEATTAPFRVVNIGNSKPERLENFIEAIEKALSTKAIKNFVPMQEGDVPSTWADTTLLESLTGYRPQTNIADGVKKFIDWYRDYYEV